MAIKKKNKKTQKGKGIIDGIANAILSDKHNRLLPGEKHQIIYLPDGTYNPARYSGPGTNLKVRISRNDQPLSYVDKVAEAHDLRYALASVDNDVRIADNKMVQLLQKGKLQQLDSNFNINQGLMIQTKILMEDKMGVPKSFFASYGRINKSPEENAMYEGKLKELEQQGFGLSHSGIHTKHLRKGK